MRAIYTPQLLIPGDHNPIMQMEFITVTVI